MAALAMAPLRHEAQSACLPRPLSSRQTFFFKFIYRGLGIAGFGATTLLAFAGAFDGYAAVRALPQLKWLRLAGRIVAAPLLFSTKAGLKEVRMDARLLYVPEFRHEIAVPATAIESVQGRRWLHLHPVTVTFRTPTAMGRAIAFMPVGRVFSALTGHPVVDELRRAVADARDRGGQP